MSWELPAASARHLPDTDEVRTTGGGSACRLSGMSLQTNRHARLGLRARDGHNGDAGCVCSNSPAHQPLLRA